MEQKKFEIAEGETKETHLVVVLWEKFKTYTLNSTEK